MLRTAAALQRVTGSGLPERVAAQYLVRFGYATEDDMHTNTDKDGAAGGTHDEDMISNLKETQGKADEKGGGKPSTDAKSPISAAQHGDIGDDRGGDKSKAQGQDPNETNANPDTHTSSDKDTADQATSEKVGSAQRSRQPGDLSQPSAGAR